MSNLPEELASLVIHEFQVVHRTRPGDGSAGWSQVQSEWGNAMLAHDTVNAVVAEHGLDPHELVGAAAERAAEASAIAPDESSAGSDAPNYTHASEPGSTP